MVAEYLKNSGCKMACPKMKANGCKSGKSAAIDPQSRWLTGHEAQGFVGSVLAKTRVSCRCGHSIK